MTIKPAIPVTCFTGFLGALGKTSTILGLLKQLPTDYKVVLLKNEYGDVEVDSLLARQSNITGVSEILNGCLCCTMVGLVENALIEIRDKFQPDRIIIESSGSAFPATLALQIRQLEPEGFRLDGVVTVIDCVNFRGYEDSSPSAKLQAKYTDLHLLSKHELVDERALDLVLDRLHDLTDDVPHVLVSRDRPVAPALVFGLDTGLFRKGGAGERADWEDMGGVGEHADEVETRRVWKGGKGKGKASEAHNGHVHDDKCGHAAETDTDEGEAGEIEPIGREHLEAELAKLNFEIYRVKGIVRLATPAGHATHILNWAFGRHDLTPYPDLDGSPELAGVAFRLTVMGERGEVARRARRLAEGLEGEVA